MTHGQVMDALKLAERFVVAVEKLAAQELDVEVRAVPLRGQAHGNPGSQVKDGAVVVESIPPQPGFPSGTVGGTIKKKGRRK